MYVISPTIFSPGAAAEKSRPTESGIGPAWPCWVVEGRHGRGWQATRPSSRISRGPARPRRATPGGPAATDPPVPVSRVRIAECLGDQQLELFSSFRRGAFRARPPLIEPGLRYSSHLHIACIVGALSATGGGVGVLSIDELILLAHRGSLAKYAAAFFRKACLHLQFTVTAFQFAQPGPLRKLQRRLSPACFCRYARTQLPRTGLIYSQFPRHIGDRPRGIHHHPGCLFPELR